jgi:rhodanese-related sulfurtransferase
MPSIRTDTHRFLIIATIAVLLLLTLVGCGSESTIAPTATSSPLGTRVETPDGAYMNLKPSELKPMLDNKDFFLVDVHTPPEGRLPNTDARVIYDKVEQNISSFPADKGAKIVLTCRSGAMSSEASKTLVRLGYTNVYNLDGGMVAWTAAGYELIPEK